MRPPQLVKPDTMPGKTFHPKEQSPELVFLTIQRVDVLQNLGFPAFEPSSLLPKLTGFSRSD